MINLLALQNVAACYAAYALWDHQYYQRNLGPLSENMLSENS